MQVSLWLGHASYVLTLDTYGEWIPEQESGAANTLPEPPAPEAADRAVVGNVINLLGRQTS